MDYSQLRAQAREQIKGNVWLFFGASLVIGLILAASSFLVIGSLLIGGACSLGLSMLIMEICRTKSGDFGTAFKGFNRFGDAFLAFLVISICVCLWSFLLIIPGIIAAYRYSMTWYILADNPDMSGTQAIKASKEMMKGHKWQLFVLHLTFIGWFLLGFITFGLAFIYVSPYIQAAQFNFYEQIKGATKAVEA